MAVDFSKMPLYFISNEGQVDEQAKFYARTSRHTLWPTREDLVFDSATRSGNRRPGKSGERAINAASTGSQIWVRQGMYDETFSLNAAKDLTLRGGRNPSYDEQTPNATFIKAPSAPQGSLTLQMLTVLP